MAVRETLALSRLKSFEPLRRLSDEQLVVLLNRAERRTYRPGQRLIERGTLDGREFFLLEGALEVAAEDGRQTTIIGGTDTRSEERRVEKECRSRWAPD